MIVGTRRHDVSFARGGRALNPQSLQCVALPGLWVGRRGSAAGSTARGFERRPRFRLVRLIVLVVILRRAASRADLHRCFERRAQRNPKETCAAAVVAERPES